MRRFGVEVEFGGDRAAAISALRGTGLSNRASQASYIGHDQNYWVIKSDGSVPRGGEMVSPPLDFDDPAQREQVTRAIEALRGCGATTDTSAGIHVHIDASDLTAEQVALVVRSFAKFEDVIYRLASSGWLTIRPGVRSYARPLPIERVQSIARCKTEDALGTAWYGSPNGHRYVSHSDETRYFGINVHSWFYRKTLEFRVFNSSLNPERVQAYIAMCMALVEDARRGNRRSINRRYALGGMASGVTDERNAFHRFQQVLRYEAGMDLEDMKRLTRLWRDSVPQRVGSTIY